MNIKFSTFRSMLKYSKDFEREQNDFIGAVERALQEKLQEADVCDYDCDLKLLFVQTGGSEGIFLQNLDKIQPPFYLLTNGGNNSLAASLEILTYAKLHGYDGEILHGDVNYIASRIRQLAFVNSVKKKLSSVKLGVIGEPSDWLISSIPQAEHLKKTLGITLKSLPLSEVEVGIDCQSTLGNKEREFEKATQVYQNIKRLASQNCLDGLTIRCFDLLSSIKMTGCWALAKLNEEGIIGTCEGDIMAMVSMLLVKVIFNQSSFQANPSRIDVVNNRIVFAHCTIPFDMLESWHYTTHFESGIGVAVKGEMRTLPVTIFRMSSSLEDYTVLQGTILRNLDESNLCRTQIEIECEDDISTLLKNPCGNHHIIFYGHHKQELLNTLSSLL